ncbi:MAG: hypothetical protein ACTILG_02130 [Sphingobacterium sp.]
MAPLKNNGLRACIALMVLLFGAFMVVKAMDNKEEKATKVANQTWHYVSGDPKLASSYSSAPVAECGTDNEVICEILAPANPSDNTKPQMTTQVVNDINSALSGTPTTNATVQSFRAE